MREKKVFKKFTRIFLNVLLGKHTSRISIFPAQKTMLEGREGYRIEVKSYLKKTLLTRLSHKLFPTSRSIYYFFFKYIYMADFTEGGE